MAPCVLQVHVDILDSDDVTPVFPSDVIRLEFREDVAVSTLLYVARAAAAAHATVGEHSTISYGLSCEDEEGEGETAAAAAGGDDGRFSVDRWTGEVRLRRPLDRELAAFHRFSLTASADNRHFGHLSVLVGVLDANDHDPVFSRPYYACHVTSSAVGRVPVCAVEATDLDEGENGRIVYFLLAHDDDDDGGVFRVDPRTGAIYADRPASGNRTLTVVATDAGASPRTSSALVLVTSDVPANVSCAVDALEMIVEENRPAHSVVGTVRLVYDDGTNVPVTRYQLIQDGGPESFDVDVETGEIVTKLILDREQQADYSFAVSAVYALQGLSRSDQ